MEISIGDVYRWTWKIIPTDRLVYWCVSQIAIVDDSGKLVDTYWHGSQTRLRLEEIDLVFVDNLKDFTETTPSAVERYHQDDILDIRHPNGGQIYLRKGAKENKEVIKANYIKKRDAAQATVDFYNSRLETL